MRCRPTQIVLYLQWRRIRFYGLCVHKPASLTRTHTSFIEQTQYRQAICFVEMVSSTPCWTQASTLACGLCRCYYFLLFFRITTHVLVSFVTLLHTLHPLSTILLSVLSLEKNCLEVRRRVGVLLSFVVFVEAQVVLSESRVSLLVHQMHAAAVAVSLVVDPTDRSSVHRRQ